METKPNRSVCFLFIVLASTASLLGFTATVSAAPGKCLLQVDGHTYLNGPCEIDMQGGGDFMVSTPRTVRPMYFATVQLNKDAGTAAGFWNGKEAESHAHDDLGTLTRKGACWSNSRAAVCAAASESDGKHAQRLEDFSCDQLITLHALTSTAQLQCGFSGYSQAWLARSRACAAQVGETQSDQDLKKGIAMFREAVGKQGKAAACSDIASSFPDAIRQ